MLPSDDPELRRSVTHAITTLDVCRRKWQALQAPGKAALTRCINGRLMLAHAEGANWPSGFAAVRHGVARRALRERHESEEAVRPVLCGLEDIVRDMRAAATALRDKVAARGRQPLRPPGASPASTPRAGSADSVENARVLIERVETIVSAFERELQLRRAVVAQLTGAGAGDDASSDVRDASTLTPGWDADARLLLSAWVLEPYLEHDKLDLTFESMAAEPTPVSRRRTI